MAKVTAPTMGFKSSGSVGKTLVNSTWRGVKVVRSYAVPSNPKTAEQTKTRSVFSFLNGVYKMLNAALNAPWGLFAKGKAFTDRNAFISANLPMLRTATNLEDFVISPGAAGGIVAAGLSATPGTGKITALMTAPALPSGWAITASHVVAILNDDPHADNASTTTYYATATTAPYSSDITVPDGSYVVLGFFQFTKSDGTTAYGPSIVKTAVVN